MEKILNKPLAIVVKTSKVVATGKDRKPIYENLDTPIVLNDWYNYVKYVGMHGFETVEVVGIVKEDKKLTGKDSKEIADLIAKYQNEIDLVIKPKIVEKDNIKEELEVQKLANSELLKRLEALENANKGNTTTSLNREKIENKATELNIQFRSNIGDEKLLDKIKEKLDPEEYNNFESEL